MPRKIRVSTKCSDGTDCVGIEVAGETIAMHDTKQPGCEPIRMSRPQFGALLAEIKDGGLDFPQN